MTKKDYILISNVINTTVAIWIEALKKWQARTKKEESIDGINTQERIDGIYKILASIDVIVQGLCYELEKDNPKFSSTYFKIACGIPQIKNNKRYNK